MPDPHTFAVLTRYAGFFMFPNHYFRLQGRSPYPALPGGGRTRRQVGLRADPARA